MDRDVARKVLTWLDSPMPHDGTVWVGRDVSVADVRAALVEACELLRKLLPDAEWSARQWADAETETAAAEARRFLGGK